MLARIISDRVRQKLLTHKRHEQSGFTPKKSTVDCILALRVLTDRLRDFRTGLLAVNVDVREAFDSMKRDVLWGILAFRGIPLKLANLSSGLYSGTESAVMCDGTISDYFQGNTGFTSGMNHSLTLSNTSMDQVLVR